MSPPNPHGARPARTYARQAMFLVVVNRLVLWLGDASMCHAAARMGYPGPRKHRMYVFDLFTHSRDF